jgi:uncharacterized membrane protein
MLRFGLRLTRSRVINLDSFININSDVSVILTFLFYVFRCFRYGSYILFMVNLVLRNEDEKSFPSKIRAKDAAKDFR